MKAIQPKIGEWILWRWIGDRNFTKSKVQNIEETKLGNVLELSDNDIWTKYPNRVLRKEIYIVKSFKE